MKEVFMEKIRIKDIAERAGVSPTTVSNVIHGNTKKVSKETIQYIEKMLEEVAYVPSMGARMLAENRSRIIGVLLGGKADKRRSAKGDAFANIIISALEYGIYSRNYYMLLHMSSTPEENLQLAATWNVEGLITIGLSTHDNMKIQSRCKVPVISIDAYYESELVANIGLDDYKGGFEMSKYLIEQGHKHILFLSDNDIGVDHERWRGVQKALREAGLPHGENLHIMIPEETEKRVQFYDTQTEALLKADALFFASDFYGAEAMNHLQDRGVKIPMDISVAGFDDSEYAQMCRPQLTTVHQNVEQKGVAAVEKLFAFIEGQKDIAMDEKLPVSLVVRESVKKSGGCNK